MGACSNSEAGTKDAEAIAKSRIRKNNGAVLREYRVVKVITERNDAVIYEATSLRTKQSVILKKYRLAILEPERVSKEISIHAEMDMPEVIRPFEYFESPTEVYLVHEMLSTPKLIDYILAGRLTQRDAKSIVRQMAQVLDLFRKKQIYFGGINLKYFFYDGETIKFSNFSNSERYRKKQKIRESSMELVYKAPEVLGKKFTYRADVWALGVLTYLLHTGSFPFIRVKDFETEDLIRSGQPKYDDIKDPLAVQFIKACLQKNPKSRIKVQNLQSHPFLRVSAVQTSEVVALDLQKLNDFSKKNQFARAFYDVIIEELLEDTEKKELHRCFQQLDKNGDRNLIREEFVEGVRVAHPSLSLIEANLIFDKVDRDGSGTIEWSEFLEVFIDNRKVLSKEKIRKCFDLFTDSNRQKLTIASIEPLFGQEIERKEFIKNSLRRYGKNEEISYAEFEKLMTDLSKELLKDSQKSENISQ